MKKFMPGIFVAFMLSMSMAPLRAEYRALEEVGTVLEHGEGEAEAGLTAGGKTSMIQGKQQALLRQPAVVSPGRVEAGQLQITQLPPEQSVRGYVARVEGRGPQIGTTENIPGIKSEAGKISFTQAPGRGKLITPEVQEAEVVGTNISTGGVGPSVRAGEARPGEAQGVMGQGEPETMTGGEPETGATGETAPVKKGLSRRQKIGIGAGVVAGGLAGLGAYEIYEHNKPGTTSGQTPAKQAETDMGTDTGATPVPMPQESGPQGGAVITPDETGMMPGETETGMTPGETETGMTPDETETGLTPGDMAIIGMTPDETQASPEATPGKTGIHGGKKPGRHMRAKTIHPAGKRHQDLTDLQKRERFSEPRVKHKAQTVKEQGTKTRMGTTVHSTEKGLRKPVKQDMTHE